MQSPNIQELITPVLNQRCWNIGKSIGSILVLDFGRKHYFISPRTRQHVYYGEYGLLIEYCDWEITHENNVIVTSEQSFHVIEEKIKVIKGNNLLKIDIGNNQKYSHFIFDNELKLNTHRYTDKKTRIEFKDGAQWSVRLQKEEYIIKDQDNFVMKI